MVDWNLAGTVILSSAFVGIIFLIVFVAIVKRLTATVDATGKAIPAAAAPSPVFVPAAPAMGDDESEIAAISAAIACYMAAAAPGTPYAIRSVRRVSGERPVWGFAGMLGNTRPF